MSSLTDFAYAQRAQLSQEDQEKLLARRIRPSIGDGRISSSLLFLQIFAAAEYFTMNKTLMETVPPVLADVILDPYILNVLPKSLVPTGIYLVILAVIAWFLSGYIWRLLSSIASEDVRDKESKRD